MHNTKGIAGSINYILRKKASEYTLLLVSKFSSLGSYKFQFVHQSTRKNCKLHSIAALLHAFFLMKW
ncbi:hypothetical protein EUGRSUZ_H03143 [Eucalyptus grandis]|uniref:Uncharacterized protein n=2 Tax=Eucalyptus grandis TaxID=71139 RepID=A0ACC3JTH7_EUCGR|nr:hypothetical protein EUGRSUZ_H03143 [Eucalyptus grandis]